jgi:hypothetical protein
MKQRCNSPSVVLFGYGNLHKACRLRAHWCNVGASSNLLGYGSLHEACRLRADGWDKTGSLPAPAAELRLTLQAVQSSAEEKERSELSRETFRCIAVQLP